MAEGQKKADPARQQLFALAFERFARLVVAVDVSRFRARPAILLFMELTPQQVNFLNQLRSRGFEVVAFPMYENFVGVRKGNCGALLTPSGTGSFQLYGDPSYLIRGQPSARTIQSDGHWFVRRGEKVQATSERTAELDAFAAELANALLPVA
jgi:hypothetical protein